MSSAMTDQKFSLLFDWFDQDRDGQLTQQDLRATAEVFAQVATDEDRTNVTAIHTAFEQWWQLLLKHADTGGDGQVSQGEFITAMQDITAPPTSRARSWRSRTRSCGPPTPTVTVS